jgi:predicted phosphatase
MAQLIGNDLVVVVDCDDTLAMWDDFHLGKKEGATEFVDPYDGATVHLHPHIQHMNLIRKYKKQGYTVIVWSAAGSLWAQEVVTKLNLNDSVDFIMSKPIKYVDDLKASEILGSRVYIPFKHIEKVIEAGDKE